MFEGVRQNNAMPEQVHDFCLVSEALADFRKGSSPGSVLSALINDQSSGVKSSLAVADVEQGAQVESLLETFNEPLARIGLAIEAVARTDSAIYSDEGRLQLRDFTIQVSDQKSFVDFLNSLQSEAPVAPRISTHLETLAHTIAEGLKNNTSFEQPNDNDIETLRSLGLVVTSYESLGLHSAVSELKEYQTYALKGCLKEFILCEKAQLLLTKDAPVFGPATWHLDATEQLYTDKWDGVVQAVTQLAENPKAAALLAAARENILECIAFAEVDIITQAEKGYFRRSENPERKERFIAVLESAKMTLESL